MNTLLKLFAFCFSLSTSTIGLAVEPTGFALPIYNNTNQPIEIGGLIIGGDLMTCAGKTTNLCVNVTPAPFNDLNITIQPHTLSKDIHVTTNTDTMKNGSIGISYSIDNTRLEATIPLFATGLGVFPYHDTAMTKSEGMNNQMPKYAVSVIQQYADEFGQGQPTASAIVISENPLADMQ